MKRCCICGCIIESPMGENNPEGACWKTETGDIVEATFEPTDVCCNECNTRYVIPGRIYKLNKVKRGEK